jgi:hypothetical protein
MGKSFLLSLSALFRCSIPFILYYILLYIFPRSIQPFPPYFHQFPPSFHIIPPYFVPFLPTSVVSHLTPFPPCFNPFLPPFTYSFSLLSSSLISFPLSFTPVPPFLVCFFNHFLSIFSSVTVFIHSATIGGGGGGFV